MNIVTEIRTVLLADSGVTDLVGTGGNALIWDAWPRVCSATSAMVIIELDEEVEEPELNGKVEWVTAEVSITCRAAVSSDSHDLQRAVRTALDGYVGTFDANLNHTVLAQPERKDGSGGESSRWYDYVMNWTMTFSEAAS
jgi:hypothetical protein